MSQEKQNNWSKFTTDRLEWRREDLKAYIQANPDEDNTTIEGWISEIDAELQSRQQSNVARR